MYDKNMIYYDGEHSIQFDGYDTWDTFHLIPTALPFPELPAQKTNYVDINGADSSIDLSNILTGYPTYENRSGSFEFIIAPNYADWMNAYSLLANFLHGKKRTLTFTDDPLYKYEGTFSISMTAEDSYNSVTIDYELKPYKKLLASVGTLYPEVFTTITINTESYVDVINDISNYFMEMPSPVTISISSEDGLYLKYWNSDYNTVVEKGPLPTGVYNDPDIVFGKYNNDANIGFQAKGVGTIRIDFTQGRL